MSTTTPFTADQLLQLPSGIGKRYELVAGELRVMTPAGWRHGKIVGNLHGLLWNHARAVDFGEVFGAETGFLLSINPDTVRAPDVALVAKENVPSYLPPKGYWPGAPDLAVEVLSPDDRQAAVHEKIDAWLSAGTLAVWIVDPQLQTLTIHEREKPSRSLAQGDLLRGDPVVPGFACPVEDIFR